jgi:hypothetical protein
MTTTTHYETLGVSESASTSEVRRAYLDLARRLHPDRWIDASADERADADRRMRAINEAWRVLGNPARRVAYEAQRRRSTEPPPRPAEPTQGFSTGSLFDLDDEGPPDAAARVVRLLPWVLLALVLGTIFVFTAYATSDSGRSTDDGTCILRQGGVVEPVSCDVEGARTVVTTVVEVGSCPSGTEPYQPADSAVALCLRSVVSGG